MQLGNDFIGPDSSYQDLLVWPEYPIELDMYSNGIPLARPDLPMSSFTELSDMSAASEPMTATSSRGSIHTRGTSIMSTSDFDNHMKPVDLSMAAPNDSAIPEFEVVIAAEGGMEPGAVQSSHVLPQLSSDGDRPPGMLGAKIQAGRDLELA